MRVVTLVGTFLALWAGSALVLSCIPWFQRRPSLAERLAPHVPREDATSVEDVEA